MNPDPDIYYCGTPGPAPCNLCGPFPTTIAALDNLRHSVKASVDDNLVVSPSYMVFRRIAVLEPIITHNVKLKEV